MSTKFFEVIISNFQVEDNYGKYRILTNNFRHTFEKPSSEDYEACHNYEKEFCENRIID